MIQTSAVITGTLSFVTILTCMVSFPSLMSEMEDIRRELDEGMNEFRNLSNELWKEMMVMGGSSRVRRAAFEAAYGSQASQPSAAYGSPAAEASQYGDSLTAPPQNGYPQDVAPQPQNGYPQDPYKSSEPEVKATPKVQFRTTSAPKTTQECVPEPGSPGIPGLPGPNGEDGMDGMDGPDGPDAMNPEPVCATGGCKAKEECMKCPPGLPGERGTPGTEGSRGMRGSKGKMGGGGESGKPGSPGPPGDQGPIGYAGKEGPKGEVGCDIQNIAGVPGEKGVPGESGEPGTPGSTGADANDGEMGPEGPPGPAGNPGIDGDPGQDGIAGIEGEPGHDARYCPCPGRNGWIDDTETHVKPVTEPPAPPRKPSPPTRPSPPPEDSYGAPTVKPAQQPSGQPEGYGETPAPVQNNYQQPPAVQPPPAGGYGRNEASANTNGGDGVPSHHPRVPATQPNQESQPQSYGPSPIAQPVPSNGAGFYSSNGVPVGSPVGAQPGFDAHAPAKQRPANRPSAVPPPVRSFKLNQPSRPSFHSSRQQVSFPQRPIRRRPIRRRGPARRRSRTPGFHFQQLRGIKRA